MHLNWSLSNDFESIKREKKRKKKATKSKCDWYLCKRSNLFENNSMHWSSTFNHMLLPVSSNTKRILLHPIPVIPIHH